MTTAPWPRTVLLLAWAAVTLPWLWPWAPPPSPSVPGLLATWVFTALLGAVLLRSAHTGRAEMSPRPLVVLLGLLAWAAWRMPVLDLALLGGLAGSVLCVAVAAQCATRAPMRMIHHVCWGMLTAALISAGIAGLQYSGLLHQPHPVLSWLHASPNEEAYGQLRQRNQFGSLMCLGLAAWMFLAHTCAASRVWRATAWISLGVLTLGAVASTSRTGALTWLGLCVITLAWSRHARLQSHTGLQQGAVAALLGFLILSWWLPNLASSLGSVELPKVSAFERLVAQPEGLGVCESRVVLWRHVLELSLQRPWLGWGWGELDFAHATQSIDGPRFCAQLGHAHNLLLHLMVEWGWPLTVLGLAGMLVWVRRHPPWRARSPAAVLGWSWLMVIGLHSLLEFPLWYGPFQLTLGLAIGLITSQNPAAQAARPYAQFAPWMPRLVVAWGACCLWASWDYHRVSQVFLPEDMRSSACRYLPYDCLDEVVWFHQGRDFARLRLAIQSHDLQQARELAQRVVHYAPEPWVLPWWSAPTRAQEPRAP